MIDNVHHSDQDEPGTGEPHDARSGRGRRGKHDKHGRDHGGAQTFRRGRALDFLARLKVKQATLKRQLDQPELQSIHPIISGELKAIETVIYEFIQAFDLHEIEQ